jgi:hypothetical protein
MGRLAFRRVMGFTATVSVSLMVMAGQPVPSAAAAATGTLFGFTGNLVAVDPATAAVTDFATLPADPNFQGFSGVANDPATHRIFIDRTVYTDQTVFPPTTADTIVTMDSQTGAGSVSPQLGQPLSQLVFDPLTNNLIGLTQSNELVRVDAASGAESNLAAVSGDFFSHMAVAPGKHALYVESSSRSAYPPPTTLLTVDTISGSVTSSPLLSRPGFDLVYDTSSGTLLGKTFCCPAAVVSIDPTTGNEVTISPDLGYGSNLAIDSATHTIFVMEDVFTGFSFTQNVATINDQTGATTVVGPTNTTTYVGTLVFQGIAVTPDSIRADVKWAFSGGSISNAGVETALLSELNGAADARSRGQCSVASRDYQAFIDTVQAQTSRTINVASSSRLVGGAIAPSTANQLVTEARYLQANCP